MKVFAARTMGIRRGLLAAVLCFGTVLAGLACNAGPGGLVGGGGSSDDNVLLNDAISFEGELSGKVLTSQSTRNSLEGESAGQNAPLAIDAANTCVRIFDITGRPLRDSVGNEIQEVSLNPDGSFDLSDMPVGVDFIVCVDIGKEGTCDVESCVNIPADENGVGGELTGVRVDPLTTIVLAKLRQLIDARGIDPRDLPISPVAVVTRVVNAYIHLFEETGIDHEITLEEIRLVLRGELAALFDEIVPLGARNGIQIVEGNLDGAVAQDGLSLALSAAKVLLRAGFPVMDEPGALDLSPLADLEGISAVPLSTFFDQIFDNEIPVDLDEILGDELPNDVTDGIDDGSIDDVLGGLDELPEDFPGDLDDLNELLEALPEGLLDGLQVAEVTSDDEPIVYFSLNAEPDRNFANADDESEGQDDVASRPIINDYILVDMALMQLEQRRITLSDLHEVITSFDEGLGARLTFIVDDPNFFGPPLNVFETPDGLGRAISLDRLFRRFQEEGFQNLTEEDFLRREAQLRGLIVELLGDTVPPEFSRMFDGFVTQRVTSVDDLTQRIREARAHLPFNFTGASTFFVVADGDPFRTEADVSPITVDANVSADGDVSGVTFNTSGTGKFYLGFTHRTEETGAVELLVRETGKFLHGPRGPVRLRMNDESVFPSVNGESFFDFVSNRGIFFPGVHVSVINDEFRPEATLPAGREAPGPHNQLFVLATRPGRDAEPVRVDYDQSSGTATFNPAGRNLLMFIPGSEETGEFALYNEATGRPAGEQDPTDFFRAPPDRPADFEEQFNDRPPDGALPPPDGDVPPPDGDMPPPDGDMPPPDGDIPPPDGDVPPPDGDVPPPDGDEPPPPDDGEVIPSEEGDGDAISDVPGDEVPVDDGSPPDGDLPPDDGLPPLVDEGPIPPPDGGFVDPGFILVNVRNVVGLDIEAVEFTHVFGTEVPNDRYNPDGDPYFDDINGNGEHDVDEPTAPFRPTLFGSDDWRATDIRLYYRRADNGASVSFDEVDFESDSPRTLDGVELVPRSYLPRRNAFRFGHPNTAINLITAFAPPSFFDGRHSLDGDTEVDVFSALAIVNLVMDQVLNAEAEIDIDGRGPLPRRRMLTDAHLFVAPVGDPFRLILDGFRRRSVVADGPDS